MRSDTLNASSNIYGDVYRKEVIKELYPYFIKISCCVIFIVLILLLTIILNIRVILMN